MAGVAQLVGASHINQKVTGVFCFFFLNCYSITVVCVFSPSLHLTTSEPTSLPHLYPLPWFCPCVLYSSSCKPLSPLSPPYSPLAIVRLFLTSGLISSQGTCLGRRFSPWLGCIRVPLSLSHPLPFFLWIKYILR